MRIVILGAGGMLGHKMYEVLSATNPETTAVFRKCPAHYSSLGLFDDRKMRGNFDARRNGELERVLGPLKPDVVINCIGLTTRKLGQQNESDIIAVNSVLPHQLKEWCIANGSKLVHFSTDCVFSGKGGPYVDQHLRDAKDLYGQSKSIGEVSGKGILTIRSSIIGLEIEGKTELLEWFLAQKGQAIEGFRNVMYSGVTTTTMAGVVKSLLERQVSFDGVAQLASPFISKFELLATANEIFQTGATIEPIDEPVSNKGLIQSQFFNDLDIHPPSWREQLMVSHAELGKYERWAANGKKSKEHDQAA